MMARARTMPELTGVFTTFSASSPQIFLAIDRTKARMLDVPIANISRPCRSISASYVNDFQRLWPRLSGARPGRSSSAWSARTSCA
jgi:HAE1 family hydrophobic/amphiphilic exporter-1